MPRPGCGTAFISRGYTDNQFKNNAWPPRWTFHGPRWLKFPIRGTSVRWWGPGQLGKHTQHTPHSGSCRESRPRCLFARPMRRGHGPIMWRTAAFPAIESLSTAKGKYPCRDDNDRTGGFFDLCQGGSRGPMGPKHRFSRPVYRDHVNAKQLGAPGFPPLGRFVPAMHSNTTPSSPPVDQIQVLYCLGMPLPGPALSYKLSLDGKVPGLGLARSGQEELKPIRAGFTKNAPLAPVRKKRNLTVPPARNCLNWPPCRNYSIPASRKKVVRCGIQSSRPGPF